jgi:glycerophosphoryl diester phosphodiesterase
MGSGIGMKYLASLLALFSSVPAQPQIVIAHRGASGERPEHTLASYERAIDQGADFIEPDLVPTRDGVLVARHENEISTTTDVADHPEFSGRKTTKLIDGRELTGWFTEDFTLAELRSLRARERLPDIRPANMRFDGLWQVPTFAEIITLAKAKEAETGRRIGLYPELKHPGYFASQQIDTRGLLLTALNGAGYTKRTDPVFIQCFEVGPLEVLRGQTALRLIQLVTAGGGPADRPGQTYAAMLTPEALRDVARHADGIGAEMGMLVGPDGKATSLVAQAHSAGLAVHAWTLRRENRFLPKAFQRGDDPNAPGDIAGAWQMLKAAGVDGVFTDNPGEIARRR